MPLSAPPDDRDILTYVLDWRSRIRRERAPRERIWKECWELYRGRQNYSNKEDWQSKIVLPKAFNSVKQTTSVVMRLLSLSQKPWTISPLDDENILEALRSSQWEKLTRQFLEIASYQQEVKTGVEMGFITGMAVWKLWWGVGERDYRTVAASPGSMGGGRLFIRSVNPMNFYWMPGSSSHSLVGTIEDVEVPKYELLRMAQEGGVFDEGVVKSLQPMRISDERTLGMGIDTVSASSQGPNPEASMVKVTEMFGPVALKDGTFIPYGHIILANDDKVLLIEDNPFYFQKCPYVVWSPLQIPFRVDGAGLIEYVRDIDRSLNSLVNMSMDTMAFRLLPIFEVVPEAFENPEDFNTLHPGKIFRRNQTFMGTPGITPVGFEDISQGSVQVAAILDRAHQEGSFISEIQQALPRYRGSMTATETDAKQQNQDTFFGGMVTDIEKEVLKPIVEMSMDLIAQYIDTSSDPRIAKILGQDQYLLAMMPREEILEMIQGDFTVSVTGISEQIEKMEMLQNLVQFMNLVGQNPQVWLPYLRSDKLLRKLLSAFRPTIDEVDDLIETPEVAQAKALAMQQQEMAPHAMGALTQMGQALLSAQSTSRQQDVDEAGLALDAAAAEKQSRDTQ